MGLWRLRRVFARACSGVARTHLGSDRFETLRHRAEGSPCAICDSPSALDGWSVLLRRLVPLGRLTVRPSCRPARCSGACARGYSAVARPTFPLHRLTALCPTATTRTLSGFGPLWVGALVGAHAAIVLAVCEVCSVQMHCAGARLSPRPFFVKLPSSCQHVVNGLRFGHTSRPHLQRGYVADPEICLSMR